MFSLIYISDSNVYFDDQKLEELADKARLKNKTLDVTGILYHKEEKFFQYLEGNSDAVLDLMEVIFKDPRHKVLRVVYLGNPSSRRFKNWDMKRIPEDALEDEGIFNLIDYILLNLINGTTSEPVIIAKLAHFLDRLSIKYAIN